MAAVKNQHAKFEEQKLQDFEKNFGKKLKKLTEDPVEEDDEWEGDNKNFKMNIKS